MYKIKDYPKLSYRFVNNLTGWFAFLIAAITYILTAEPTASLWDCGEFITTSVGLQVGHPPGAPLFMIISRLFAIFAPSPEKQALMINYMSALASAFTILFLFWTISHLARKLVLKGSKECSLSQLIAIMGAALVGSLVYTFSDTFWFSAVEAEVYALSSLFTAVVFWAILKWENIADEPYANRWLVFIAYLIGLSIGVHLLNLLAIPAIVFVYYFRKYTPNRNGVIKTAILSLIILGFVNFLLIPGVIKIACYFELMFVNGMGLPFNTGVIVYALLLIVGLVYGIHYTLRKNKTILNTIFTCFVVIMIGYSSYAMIVIRSISNPPIDENSPDNVFDLLSYINRDQYGDSPLIYGQYYNAKLVDVEEGSPVYYQNRTTGKYEKVGTSQKPIYDKRFSTIFPRMYSGRSQMHIYEYENWGGKPNGRIYDVEGEAIQKPSFGNNLRYFFRYQLGHMYWRYFMWNFSGRQNDIQGDGDIRYGNWITGIKFLDQMRLGNQNELPNSLKDQKASNKYFLLPFILGILGIIFQLSQGKEGKKDFWVVLLLFFLTGIAIIIFLNQTPREPRERDYAYAGSFYAFSIWIGLGVLFIWDRLYKVFHSKTAAIVATTLCLIIPGIMAAQNWDDHNRSGRYATIAHAKNYLNSCGENAIIFTFGDNDTFPLWYAQEVEGVRRDIRIVNLSLLSGDWYIDQINRKAYESDKVEISVTKDQYHKGKRDYVYIIDFVQSAYIKNAITFVFNDAPNTKKPIFRREELSDYFPTRTLYLPVDSAKVVANGTVAVQDADKILDRLEIKLPGDGLTKSQLMVLDIISTNNWERPIYFGIGMGTENYLGFEKYFQLEGAAYRIVPIETEGDLLDGFGSINTDILYTNIMDKFEWGNINDPKVNMDYFHDFTISVMQYRNTFYRLAKTLYEEGKPEKAVAVLDKSLYELPTWQVPIDDRLYFYVPLYYELGETEKANQLLLQIFTDNYQMSKYINSLEPRFISQTLLRDERRSRGMMELLAEIAAQSGQLNILRDFLANAEGINIQEPVYPNQMELQHEIKVETNEEMQQDTQVWDVD